jgi:hypothetical protein
MFSRMLAFASMFLITTIGLSTVAAAACSNSSISGIYGFSTSGVNGDGLPEAVVGQFTATPGTPSGVLSGTETVSSDGTIGTVSFAGTYQVSGNCTGQVTVKVSGSKNAAHLRLVIVSGGAEIDFVNTDPGQAGAGYALAQGNATCTDLGVKANYGFQDTGLVVGSGAIALTGRLTFDGKGGAAGSESGTQAGAVVTNVPLSGSYSINSDCIGSATVTPQGGVAIDFSFVVANGGKTLLAIDTDATTVITGTLKR